MIRGPKPQPLPTGTANRSLPDGEPLANSLEQQLHHLETSLAGLEGQFRFMGTAHPEYESTKLRIESLEVMLERVKEMLGQR